jgi:hypothetical protein
LFNIYFCSAGKAGQSCLTPSKTPLPEKAKQKPCSRRGECADLLFSPSMKMNYLVVFITVNELAFSLMLAPKKRTPNARQMCGGQTII